MKQNLWMAAGLSLLLAACGGNATDKIKSADERAAAKKERQAVEAQVNNKELAIFEWEKEFHDFGNITEGERVTTTFTFENTGESPLIISNARGSCGCTVPDYPRKPIAPGATGEIKVSFDSSNRAGKQDKTVTIDANTVPRSTILKITSNVMPKNTKQ